MRCALSESEKLDHEYTVIATGFSLLEESVEVGTESVLGLVLIN
jgi:hypothetical protein